VSVHRQRVEAVVAPLLQKVRRQRVMLGERLWRNIVRTTEVTTFGFSAITAALVVLAALPQLAPAGFWALPLEAEIDRAEAIVLGKLVRIEPTRREHEGRMTYARGVIAVREMLKGTPSREVSLIVVSALDHDLGGQMQSPPRVHRVGQDGIWIIVGGRPSHGYGLLPQSRLDEVRTILSDSKSARGVTRPTD
jgi:hypothetical protein